VYDDAYHACDLDQNANITSLRWRKIDQNIRHIDIISTTDMIIFEQDNGIIYHAKLNMDNFTVIPVEDRVKEEEEKARDDPFRWWPWPDVPSDR
jgi:hypothetical protein